MAMSTSPSTSGPVEGLGHDLERDAGVLGAEVAQDRDRETMRERRRQGDLQHPLRLALLLDDLAERLVDAVEGFRHDRQDVASGLGQHELLRPALEQRDPEEVLEHDHMPADRALRDRQAVGGSREAQVLPRRLERSERVQRQPLAIHPPSPRLHVAQGRRLKAR